jgi:acetylornithine/N-succinyldiaminopimelate aminotransferase
VLLSPRVIVRTARGRSCTRGPVAAKDCGLAGFLTPGRFVVIWRGMAEAESILTSTNWLDRGRAVLIGNYARSPIVMERGEGSLVFDTAGNRYVDLFAGFGGAILGHAHPELVRAATEQAQKLWHVGNTFHSEPQIELGERLNRHAFPGQAFFCHSGMESNEAAVKLARLRGQEKSPARWKMLSFHKSFHGRSLAMISATGNPAVRAGFGPNVPGFTLVEPGDFEALEKAVDDETAGIIMEPIQGEGGVNLYPDGFAQRVRELCDTRELTLIFDEVWTGCGRTGRWFAHQHFAGKDGKPVVPDIMTLGKAVGGGLPVGVMWARPEIAKLLVPGRHGSTLGGNAICMAVSRTIFDVIERDDLVNYAAVLGEHAIARLKNEKKIQPKVAAVRGRGLFIGVELKQPPEGLVDRALERGLIVNVTAKNVIRLAPPINIDRAMLDQGLDILVSVLAEA